MSRVQTTAFGVLALAIAVAARVYVMRPAGIEDRGVVPSDSASLERAASEPRGKPMHADQVAIEIGADGSSAKRSGVTPGEARQIRTESDAPTKAVMVPAQLAELSRLRAFFERKPNADRARGLLQESIHLILDAENRWDPIAEVADPNAPRRKPEGDFDSEQYMLYASGDVKRGYHLRKAEFPEYFELEDMNDADLLDEAAQRRVLARADLAAERAGR